MEIKSYQDLQVWRKAINLVTEIYRITLQFPQEEKFGIIQQIRRAAVSIPANIAEGWGRNVTKEYNHFLRIARGSLLELETYLTIASNLGYMNRQSKENFMEMTQEISKMLNSLINKIRQ